MQEIPEHHLAHLGQLLLNEPLRTVLEYAYNAGARDSLAGVRRLINSARIKPQSYDARLGYGQSLDYCDVMADKYAIVEKW